MDKNRGRDFVTYWIWDGIEEEDGKKLRIDIYRMKKNASRESHVHRQIAICDIGDV